MAEISIQSQINKVNDFAKGYRATHVIDTGMKFGLLEALSETPGGMTTSELALKLMLHEPFIRIWCQTAYHFEILDGDEQGRFRLQPFLSEVLGLGMSFRPQIVGTDFSSESGIQPGPESPLFDYIRSGRTIRTGKTASASFATYRGTINLPVIFFSMIFPENEQIKNSLEQGVRMLEIGCGSGNLLLEFARVFNNSAFVGIDPDFYGIESAERAISELGLENQITVEDLGGEEMHFKEEFDLAGMILTLHEIPPGVRPEVLSRTYQALKKEGQLMVLDYPYPERLEDFRDPVYSYGVIEQYFEAVNGIIHLSGRQQDKLLSEAGFKDIKRARVSHDMFDFILVQK